MIEWLFDAEGSWNYFYFKPHESVSFTAALPGPHHNVPKQREEVSLS